MTTLTLPANSLARRVYAAAIAVVVGCNCTGCEQAQSTASQVTSPAASLEPTPDEAQTVKQSNTAAASDEIVSGDAPPKLDFPDDPKATVDPTFDHIKFDIEPDAKFDKAMLTPTINKLFDRNIRIRGYMYPTLKKRGIKQFILVRDNQECCFGPGAALYDCILVHMKEGKTAEYSIRPVAVEGKFSYEVFPDYDGTTRAIYRLDGESVD